MSKNREKLNELFYEAYHSYDNVRNIHNFLKAEFPNAQSEHLKALLHFTRPEVHKDHGKPMELPGMVYGMINKAWELFLDEQFSKR
jgi:hypothetical protein